MTDLQTLSQEPGQIYRHYLKSYDRFTDIISRAMTDLQTLSQERDKPQIKFDKPVFIC